MSKSVVKCKKINLKSEFINGGPDYELHWYIYTLDGRILYEICKNGSITIDLSNRDMYYIYPGIKIQLKVYGLVNYVHISDILLEYSPDSSLTAYFSFKGDGISAELYYNGAW